MPNLSNKLDFQQLSLFSDIETKTDFIGLWLDEEIEDLQESMLIQAMKEVRDKRKSLQMRTEAFNWFMEDSNHPFSSNCCASNNGYDIHFLRRSLRTLVPDL